MTRAPRLSSKRIRSASAPLAPAKKLTKPDGKARKPSKDTAKMKAKAKVMVKVEETAMKARPQITTATITIKRTEIDYDEKLAEAAGGYTIAPGTIVAPNGDTLLHLLFFAIFSSEGKKLFEANGPESAATPDLAKANLKEKLLKKFPALTDADRPGLLDTVIDGHFAADWYVKAYKAEDAAGKQAWQQAYSQKLLAILGELHDDALAHEFSMLW